MSFQDLELAVQKQAEIIEQLNNDHERNMNNIKERMKQEILSSTNLDVKQRTKLLFESHLEDDRNPTTGVISICNGHARNPVQTENEETDTIKNGNVMEVTCTRASENIATIEKSQDNIDSYNKTRDALNPEITVNAQCQMRPSTSLKLNEMRRNDKLNKRCAAHATCQIRPSTSTKIIASRNCSKRPMTTANVHEIHAIKEVIYSHRERSCRPKTASSSFANSKRKKGTMKRNLLLQDIQTENETKCSSDIEIAPRAIHLLEKSALLVKEMTGRQISAHVSNTIAVECEHVKKIQSNLENLDEERGKDKLDTSTDSVYSQDSNANEMNAPCHIAEFEAEISATMQKSSVSDRVCSPSYHCSPTIRECSDKKSGSITQFQNKDYVTSDCMSLPRRIHSSMTSTGYSKRPTTALERRQSRRPNTVACIRSDSEALGRKLLGPINMNAPLSKAPLPKSLAESDWENELARNILTVFSNKVVGEVRGSKEEIKNGCSDLSMKEEEKIEIGHCTDSLQTNDKHCALNTPSQINSQSPAHNEREEPDVEQSSNITRVSAKLRPKMIWFCGTGAGTAEWSALRDFRVKDSHLICIQLDDLKVKEHFSQYVNLAEMFICAQASVCCSEQETVLMHRLWRQLVVVCNTFATRYIEKRKFAKSLELLEKAYNLAGFDKLVTTDTTRELRAFVNDTYAYYYAQRQKPSAALKYVTRSMKVHLQRKDWQSVSICHLHTAYVLGRLSKHDEAIRCMGQILSLVNDGSLVMNSGSLKLVLLIAVTFHNIAVQQIILGYTGEACISSQNARRLSRMCLTLSNRYIPTLESTHKRALHDLTTLSKHRNSTKNKKEFSSLMRQLFD